MKSYLIDCDSCQGAPTHCGECLMTFLATPEFGTPVRFSEEERDALDVMADVGLLPRLRLVAA
ncbi:MAG: hypothetical protein FWD75_00830 [Propionibacteriaceae bacterium]|nr:hypothetical protein [Propionibacteriaceae bacterium]